MNLQRRMFNGAGLTKNRTLVMPSKSCSHQITFFSKSLLPAEHNYDIYDHELLAIIYAVKAFRHLLLEERHPFLIRSDHKNLTYFKQAHSLSARQARWHALLQDYQFTLEHFPGKSNTTADLLS